jgi:hypothetical protein
MRDYYGFPTEEKCRICGNPVFYIPNGRGGMTIYEMFPKSQRQKLMDKKFERIMTRISETIPHPMRRPLPSIYSDLPLPLQSEIMSELLKEQVIVVEASARAKK